MKMNKKDRTLIWVIISLMVCISVQMIGTLRLKDEIKDLENQIKQLKTKNEVHK